MPRISPRCSSKSTPCARGRKLFGLQDHSSPIECEAYGGNRFCGIAAHHQPDETSGIEPGERTIGGDCPVLQHGDVVAEVENLVQPVRDIEDGDALVAQPANKLHQYRHVRRGER